MILFPFSISTDLTIVLEWWWTEIREEYLRDIHTRSEYNRASIHIRELEGDIEIVSRIDESGGIMDDESEPRERRFPWELDEILLRAKFLDTRTQNGHSRTKYEPILCRYGNLLILRKYLLHGVNIRDRIVLHDKELLTEANIVARWLQSWTMEIGDEDIALFECSMDITIRKIHRERNEWY